MSMVLWPEWQKLKVHGVGFRPKMEIFQDASGTWLVRAKDGSLVAELI